MRIANLPYIYAADPTKGRPIFNGSIYIGQPDLDPSIPANQIAVSGQQESGAIVALAQPIETGAGGVPLYNGSPIVLIIDQSPFSILVNDNIGSQKYYQARANSFEIPIADTETSLTVDTLKGVSSSLEALTGMSDGQIVSTKGYWSVGDGGHGTYRYDSSSVATVNGVTVINAAGGVGRWLLLHNGILFAKTCGIRSGGSDAAANSTQLIAARATGIPIKFPVGTFKFDTVSTGTGDLLVEGEGDGTVLDFTGSISGGNYALEAIGTATQIEELNATATAGTNSVVFTSAPSLSIGDVFVIFNPTNSSWSGFRTNYYAGEWCEVESIAGSTVTTKNQLYDTYLAAAVDVYKITGPKVVLRNFKITGTTIEGLVSPTLCLNPLVENVSGDHANNVVIYFNRCYEPVCNNPHIKNIGDGGDDYGIVVGSGQHARINGGSIYGRRHAIATGGGTEVCSTPIRDCITDGSVLKNDIDSGTHCADFHGHTELSKYVNCTIFGGGSLQGKDNDFVNCTITNSLQGWFIYHAEIKGGRLGCTDCRFISNINPQPFVRGLYDIGGNNTPVTASTTIDTTFFVNNCSVYGRNMGATTSFMLFKNNGATVKTNFVIDGLDGDVDNIGQILLTQNASGTPASDYIVIDNIKKFPTGTQLHNASGAAYTNFSHRCQKQTGTRSITTSTIASIVLDSAQTFKYAYPRAPSAQATSVGGYAGNRMAYASFNALSGTGYTLQIESGDATNWSSAVARNVNWVASLDEV